MAAMPRVADCQVTASSSSATETLKPWRSWSLRERTTWRRSLSDWACSMRISRVSWATGMVVRICHGQCKAGLGGRGKFFLGVRLRLRESWREGGMSLEPGNVVSNLRELRELTANADGAQRVAFTPTWLKAREWFGAKLIGLPVERHFDAAGNQWVTLRGQSEKTLVLGSHLDSVPNGGWLDGALGVVAGLEVVRYLAEKYNGKPPFTVRLVDWADEEGARFGRSLFGSAAFAGTHTIAADRGRTDRDGVTLEAALKQVGIDIDRIGDAAAERRNIAAYLELHI